MQPTRVVHMAHGVLLAFVLFQAAGAFNVKPLLPNETRTGSARLASSQLVAVHATATGYQASVPTGSGTQRRLSAKKRVRVARILDISGCPSDTLEWPKASGFCWNKRETFGALQGPGNNVFAASNVLLDNSSDTLTLNMVKKGTQTSCSEVILNRSLGFGDYMWQTVTDPNTMHPSMVGASFIYADNNREFDIVYSRWSGSKSQQSIQYTMHPEAPGSQLEFYGGSGGMLTHRLRWSGSSGPNQVQFETWTSAGTLLVSWTTQGGTNFIPGDERVHLNHWIANSADVPPSSSYTLNCFSFCPLGQQPQCSTPLGLKPTCGSTIKANPSPPQPPIANPTASLTPNTATSSPSQVTNSPSMAASPPPPQPPLANPQKVSQLSPCPDGAFRWPVDRDYCWYTRDTNGDWQGPGNNTFRSQNVNVDPNTGSLVLTVGADAAGTLSAGEVFLDRSLGLGDYVFTVQTDPSLMHDNLVGSPFIYADPNAAGAREFDIEYARWGMPDIPNTQYVVQPYTSNKEHRLKMTGEMFTHRIRWSGTSTPDQVQFETWSVTGQQVHAWTNAGGNNFIPGDERVHINHWVYATTGVPAQNYFVLTCFKFCPLGDNSCGVYGTKPIC